MPLQRRTIILGTAAIELLLIVAGVLSLPALHNGLERQTKNIAYCGTANEQQTLDMYPAQHHGASPYVVYIHGGGWRQGDKINALSRVYSSFFTSRGITFVSVNYRLAPKAVYPAQNTDVACALAFLDDNAGRLGLDPTKSLLFGDSAGGELAAFAALVIPYKGYDYHAPKGVIDFYGVSNFSSALSGIRPDKNARLYLGSKYNAVADLASPVHYISKTSPRFLFIHGSADTVVPISQTSVFNSRLQASGIDTELIVLSNVGHGFRGPELSSKNRRLVTDGLAAYVSEVF